jgi:hypothetical protein
MKEGLMRRLHLPNVLVAVLLLAGFLVPSAAIALTVPADNSKVVPLTRMEKVACP